MLPVELPESFDENYQICGTVFECKSVLSDNKRCLQVLMRVRTRPKNRPTPSLSRSTFLTDPAFAPTKASLSRQGKRAILMFCCKTRHRYIFFPTLPSIACGRPFDCLAAALAIEVMTETGAFRMWLPEATYQAVMNLVERFDRRGTEPFELFRSEFGQNSGTFKFCVGSQNAENGEAFARKFKNFGKIQHFLKYRRNSDKRSSKSEQKSMKRIQK